MSYRHRYTVRSIPPHSAHILEAWEVHKFDKFGEHEGKYTVSKVYSPSNPKLYMLSCECFAGNKETCRHRQMIEVFTESNAIDSGQTYDFDKKRWYPATNIEV